MNVDPYHWPYVIEFFARVADEEYPIPTCGNCGESFFPPRVLCPYCLSNDLGYTTAAGTGTLHSFSVVRVDHHPDWGARAPYVNALISLDDGPVVFGNIVDCDPVDLSVGMEVTVTFDEAVGDSETTMPYFTPV